MVRAARWAGWVRCCSGVPAHRGRGRDPSAASWCKGQTAFLHLPTLLHNSSTCASICICSCFVRLQVSASFFLKTPVWEMSDKAKIWLPSKKSSAELCYDTHSTEHTKCCQWAAGTGTTKHTDGGGTHQIVTLGCRSPELGQTYQQMKDCTGWWYWASPQPTPGSSCLGCCAQMGHRAAVISCPALRSAAES